MKLFELQTINGDSTEEELINFIKSNCQPILKEYSKTKNRLWRGSETNEYDIVRSVRANREPVDSSGFFTQEANKLFVKEIGIPMRTSSIFCTGDKKVAENYAQPFMIFPIGEFKIAWSEYVGDAYSQLDPFGLSVYSREFTGKMFDALVKMKLLKSDDLNLGWPKIHNFYEKLEQSEKVQVFKHLLSDGKLYSYDDLKAALASKNEIMVNCKEYVALSALYNPIIRAVLE